MDWVSRSALAAIRGYQRWISPRKGFRCAYSVAHGGTGCSGFAKHAIAADGLWQALPQIRARLRACAGAAQQLRTEKHDTPEADEPDTRAQRRESGCRAYTRESCKDCIGDSAYSGCMESGFSLLLRLIRGSARSGPDYDGCDCTPW